MRHNKKKMPSAAKPKDLFSAVRIRLGFLHNMQYPPPFFLPCSETKLFCFPPIEIILIICYNNHVCQFLRKEQ